MLSSPQIFKNLNYVYIIANLRKEEQIELENELDKLITGC